MAGRRIGKEIPTDPTQDNGSSILPFRSDQLSSSNGFSSANGASAPEITTQEITKASTQETSQVTSHANEWINASGEQIEWHWLAEMLQQPDATHIILDKDDTLIPSLTENWVPHLVWRIYRRQGKAVYMQQLDRILKSDNPFKEIIDVMGLEEFKKVEQFLRFNSRANTRGELIDPDIPNHLTNILERQGNVLGVLTARPDTTKIKQLTYQWLQARGLNGLSTLPLYHAPVELNHQQTQRWKVTVMERLRRRAEEVPFILIDDSLSTAKAIQQWNQENTDYAPLMQVVPMTPLTEASIRQSSRQVHHENGNSGVFIAESWSQIPSVVEEAREQWEQTRRSRQWYKRRNHSAR